MNTYLAGYELAKQDVEKHGSMHAIDKTVLFEGDFGQGYADAILAAVVNK